MTRDQIRGAACIFFFTAGLFLIQADLLLAKIDQRKLDQIVEGKTTEPQVVKILGKPKGRYLNPDGTKTYAYYSGRMLPSETLTITFDKNDVVAAVKGSRQKLSVGGPFGMYKNRKLDPAKWAQVQAGKTTEEEVLQLLGKPVLKTENSDGTKTYSYVYGRLTNVQEMRAITIDSTGVVLSWTTGSFALPGLPPGKKKNKMAYDPDRWAMIVEGKTSDKDVVDLIGEPKTSITNPNGTKTYMYQYGQVDLSEYSIQFDSSGIVRSISRTSMSTRRAPDAVLVAGKKKAIATLKGQRINPEKWRTITPGVTTEADVFEMFGSPQMTIPKEDGTKAYLYTYSESATSGGLFTGPKVREYQENYQVLFNKRGVVISTGEPSALDGLLLRSLPPMISTNWGYLAEHKPDEAKVIELVGEPQQKVPNSDGSGYSFYIYQVGSTSVESYTVSFNRDRLVTSVSHAKNGVKDINALTQTMDRVKWDTIVVGKSTVADVIAQCSEPQHRLDDADGGKVLVYLSGQIKTSAFAWGGVQSEQRCWIYLFTVDKDGRVTSLRKL